MTYTINTTPEQDVVLGIAAQANNNETSQQALNDIVTAALLTLQARQEDSFISTIRANEGEETLEAQANAAQQNPNPNETAP